MCEMPAVFGQEQRKARKEHKCCECAGLIKPGETYTYSHGVWDGITATLSELWLSSTCSFRRPNERARPV